MQDIENNMDDLFRKAAENYPLKTGESRWDEVAAAIPGNAAIAAKKKNNRRKYSVLLLLLIAGLLLGGGLIINTTTKNKITGSTDEKSAIKADNIPGANNDVNYDHTRTVEGGKNLMKLKSEWLDIGGSSLMNKVIVSTMVFENENRKNDNDPVLQKTNIAENQNYIQLITPFTIEENDPEKNPLANPYKAIQNTDEAIQNINKQERSVDDKKNEIHKSKNPFQKSKGFYFGIAAGPSFSEVKSQGLKKAGIDVGVLAGYQLSNNFSAETGVLFSKKYYYSDGKYFNMSKMPANMQVESLEGSSAVFEIPVKMRYRVTTGNKNYLSFSAGLSSFILTKEKNDYRLLVSGVQQNMISIYKATHSYINASVNLSVGYERKISKYSSVRIEPYLKIPLKGIGIGSMHVMSTGLQIAVTRQSH